MAIITLRTPASTSQEIIFTEPGQAFELGFPTNSVVFERTGTDLVINHYSGAQTVLLGFFSASALVDDLPAFMIEGQQFSSAAFLTLLDPSFDVSPADAPVGQLNDAVRSVRGCEAPGKTVTSISSDNNVQLERLAGYGLFRGDGAAQKPNQPGPMELAGLHGPPDSRSSVPGSSGSAGAASASNYQYSIQAAADPGSGVNGAAVTDENLEDSDMLLKSEGGGGQVWDNSRTAKKLASIFNSVEPLESFETFENFEPEDDPTLGYGRYELDLEGIEFDCFGNLLMGEEQMASGQQENGEGSEAEEHPGQVQLVYPEPLSQGENLHYELSRFSHDAASDFLELVGKGCSTINLDGVNCKLLLAELAAILDGFEVIDLRGGHPDELIIDGSIKPMGCGGLNPGLFGRVDDGLRPALTDAGNPVLRINRDDDDTVKITDGWSRTGMPVIYDSIAYDVYCNQEADEYILVQQVLNQ